MMTAILGILGPLLMKLIPDKDLREKTEAKLGSMVISGELQRELAAANIVQAEAGSEHWLTSTWRPALMWICIIIVGHEYLLVPYLTKIFGNWVTLGLNDNIWNLINIGLGGYIIGRSGEKIAKSVKDGRSWGYQREEKYEDINPNRKY